MINSLLKNVFEAADARQKSAKKRSLHIVNEHFELIFNAAAATQIVFQQAVKTLCYALLLLTLSACTTVQPWQRDVLAKPSMALVPDKVTHALDEHIYFSKEASLGGQGVGGGGCGCN